jgi:hypothetical protein
MPGLHNPTISDLRRQPRSFPAWLNVWTTYPRSSALLLKQGLDASAIPHLDTAVAAQLLDQFERTLPILRENDRAVRPELEKNQNEGSAVLAPR